MSLNFTWVKNLAAVMLLLATTQAQTTNSAYDNDFPQWSLDNKQIIFASTRDGGDYEVYTMSSDGSGARRLTFVPGRDAHPYYLPHSDRILFQSPRGQSNDREVDLYVMDADGKNQRVLKTKSGFNGVPVPSRDGKKIAFMRGIWQEPAESFHWEILLADANAKNERPLTNNAWSSQVPSWFPNDRDIAFYANPKGRDQLFMLNRVSNSVSQLATSSANDRAPSVSPNGKLLAFTSDRDSESDLYVLELASGAVRRLTINANVRGQPGWSRDGKKIVFSGASLGAYDVYVIGVDGAGLKRLTYGAEGTR